MIVVSDRLHDLDWVETVPHIGHVRWWRGAGGSRQIEPVDDSTNRPPRVSFEINLTSETEFLFPPAPQLVYIEESYCTGGDRCILESGTAKIVHGSWSVRTQEEVYQRIELDLNYVQGAPSIQEISYAEFLELDTSSFRAGWKRWFEEWVLFARVSIFGDR